MRPNDSDAAAVAFANAIAAISRQTCGELEKLTVEDLAKFLVGTCAITVNIVDGRVIIGTREISHEGRA